jgi:general nucleoside transport system ATP-binding protein
MLVELKNIRKVFGEVVALDDVDFSIEKGGIHGLLGENGAGKTTLMNILYGYYQLDRGEIILEGRPVRIRSPQEAIRLGIGMVHQLSTLVPEFTAVENIILGTEGKRLSFSLGGERPGIQKLCEEVGLSFPLNVKVRELPAGIKQKIEIIRALYRGAKLIILDEPTTYLVESEFEQLLKSVKKLTDQGITIILITHKIREVMKACDTVTVMRKGKVEGEIDRREMDREKLVKMMFIEKEIKITESALPRVQVPDCRRSESPVLQVQNLSVEAGEKGVGVSHLSFDLYGGEILGVASVSGNGVKELVEALIHPSRVKEGDIRVKGESLRGLSTLEVFARGVFFTPEERVQQGILTEGSIKENVLLGHHGEKRFLRRNLFTNWEEAGQAARKTIEDYAVYTPNEDFLIKKLSGGNIQKVIIGRAFVSPICLLITHNPTVGLDISSVEFIFQKLVEIRNQGEAVLWVNEDLDELMMLSDRIAVIHRGELRGIFERNQFDKYQIGLAMIGA